MSINNNERKKLNFKQNHYGVEKRQEWVNEINAHTGNLPESVSLEDIDVEFLNMVKTSLSPVVELLKNGNVIKDRMPVYLLTSQRWSEFSKTWEFTNDMKEISLPFISVIRHTDVQPGTINNGLYNIPGRRTWTYLKVPNTQHDRDGVDLYKIPQPTALDLTYEVKIFTTKMLDMNKAVESFHREYDSRQKYIVVKGHPMPSVNEGVNDESVLDLEERKMYVTSFEIMVQGYILDQNEFEIVNGINRIVTVTELSNKNNQKKK